MEIISVNAETKLFSLASSIGRSPQSWRGWHSLRVSLDGLDDNTQSECLFWVKSLISSYLKDAEGRVYFYENNAIHIVCKSVPTDVLEQTGQQIYDLAQSESSACITYHIYDLTKDGEAYAQEILEQQNNIFYNSSKNTIDLDNYVDKHITPKGDVKSDKISTERTKVLLVEDDPVTRWLVRNSIKDDCDFATAPTASKAFTLYSVYQPDVMFLDIDLPDKSGYEVLEWVMKNDPGANVIMFSSQSNMDNITNALEVGAKGFVGKPFIKKQLLEYIHGNA
ncbi:MAG: response regulator [Alphaproteobacteria bacterium]